MRKFQTDYSWHGFDDMTSTSFACLIQKYYSEIHGSSCLHEGCNHGFKEVHYRTPEEVQLFRTIFPSAKFIINYRATCSESYIDKFQRNCSTIGTQTKQLLDSSKSHHEVFHMETEQLKNKSRWAELAKFLGFQCEPLKVISANVGSYSKTNFIAWNHDANTWDCSESLGLK